MAHNGMGDCFVPNFRVSKKFNVALALKWRSQYKFSVSFFSTEVSGQTYNSSPFHCGLYSNHCDCYNVKWNYFNSRKLIVQACLVRNSDQYHKHAIACNNVV